MILVDVGVWLAAIWGRHAHHRVARQWFDEQPGDLVLCRVTQMSLLRLITNPAIMGEDAVTRSEAWRLIDQIWADDRVLWAEEPDQLEAVFRAISDRASDGTVDAEVFAMSNQDGSPNEAAITAFLEKYPERIPMLVQMAEDSTLATERAAAAAIAAARTL